MTLIEAEELDMKTATEEERQEALKVMLKFLEDTFAIKK